MWPDPDLFPDPPHKKQNFYYNAIIVAYNDKFGRKWTVPSASPTIICTNESIEST